MSARKSAKRTSPQRDAMQLRIIGGRLRGRKIAYSGDPRTRPMKDRLREAIFNLIGAELRGKRAVDLFAGTGALALEAISRGAAAATLIEQHFPTAAIIRRNAAALGVDAAVETATANVFIWWKRQPDLGTDPWAVFCSPPYDFYIERTDEMLELIEGLVAAAPGGSLFAVEADKRFDFALLPHADDWDVRTYPPAVVGIYRKQPG
jgi:16S rRNA (guanine966-N2)-methyltransferase